MNDNEIIELYWARNENAITASEEKYGRYCHFISYNMQLFTTSITLALIPFILRTHSIGFVALSCSVTSSEAA